MNFQKFECTFVNLIVKLNEGDKILIYDIMQSVSSSLVSSRSTFAFNLLSTARFSFLERPTIFQEVFLVSCFFEQYFLLLLSQKHMTCLYCVLPLKSIKINSWKIKKKEIVDLIKDFLFEQKFLRK